MYFIGNKFCWLLPHSRSTSWTQISWHTNWARIRSLIYFAWLMKVPSFSCLIWSPRKKLSSPIMLISNSLCIHLENYSQRETLVAPKIISSTYIWTKSMSFSLVVMKRVINFPHFKTLFQNKLLNISYHALGACFKP